MKTKRWRDLYVLVMEKSGKYIAKLKKTKLYIQYVLVTDCFYNCLFTNAQMGIENFWKDILERV